MVSGGLLHTNNNNNNMRSEWERQKAEQAAEARRTMDPWQIGQWVVVKTNNIPPSMDTDGLNYYDGCIGEIIAPLEEQPNERSVKFLNDEKSVKSFPIHFLASVRDTRGITVEHDVCWDADKHMKLAQHIEDIEEYQYWHYECPRVPDWYLHSLKTSRRYWRIPPDYARIPPGGFMGNESRSVHFAPRHGYLELTIQSDGQVYADKLEAFSVLVTTVRDILPPHQRATMSFFQAKAYMGGKVAHCSAVFHITNALEVPDVTIDSSHPHTIVREGHVLESTIAHIVGQYLTSDD